MRTKTLWVQDKYLEQILSGKKSVEVRVGYRNVARLQVGDRVLLNHKHPYRILRVGHYSSFEEMIAFEEPDEIAPGLSGPEVVSACQALYPAEKEALGVITLQISPVE